MNVQLALVYMYVYINIMVHSKHFCITNHNLKLNISQSLIVVLRNIQQSLPKSTRILTILIILRTTI